MRASTFVEPSITTRPLIWSHILEAPFTVAKTKPILPTAWRAPAAVLGGLILILTVLTFFYTFLLPDKVNSTIAASPTLTGIRDDIREMSKNLGELKDDLGALKTDVKDIKPLLPALRNPTLMVEALKSMTSLDTLSLAKELPEARKLLAILRESKRALPPKAYREISAPLKKGYDSAPPDLKNEIWLTFIDLASAKSTTDSIAYALPEPELLRAKSSGRFFEGGVRDLSDKQEWKDTIFTGCRIVISKPGQALALTRVRFVDVEFQALPQNLGTYNLLVSVVDSDEPAVSGVIEPYVTVSPPKRYTPFGSDGQKKEGKD